MSNHDQDRPRDLHARVSDLEKVLGGNMVTGEKGMVQIVRDIATDMYGARGLSPRVEKLEEFKLRGEERAKGAIWVARIFWALLATGFGYWLKTWIK